jgi:hypothetical protein
MHLDGLFGDFVSTKEFKNIHLPDAKNVKPLSRENSVNGDTTNAFGRTGEHYITGFSTFTNFDFYFKKHSKFFKKKNTMVIIVIVILVLFILYMSI